MARIYQFQLTGYQTRIDALESENWDNAVSALDRPWRGALARTHEDLVVSVESGAKVRKDQPLQKFGLVYPKK